jgi:putative FmdB family regulatory protein
VPIYAYRCADCGEVTDTLAAVGAAPASVRCAHCEGERTRRIITRVAYHASEASKAARLDPKYDRMVEHSLAKSRSADPDRLLRKMKPFSGE